MYNCIYSGHCTQTMCDKSCPTLAETTYLLERNNISMSSDVFSMSGDDMSRCLKILESAEGRLYTEIVPGKQSTVAVADMLTYCGICQRWRGSRLHCTVYNLRFSNYIEAIRNSWSSKNETEEMEYMKIWASSAKLLIISSMDYVNFRDFECQTLLTLLQSRASKEYTTIIVTPSTDSLVGNSNFLARLTQVLNDTSVKESKAVKNK